MAWWWFNFIIVFILGGLNSWKLAIVWLNNDKSLSNAFLFASFLFFSKKDLKAFTL